MKTRIILTLFFLVLLASLLFAQESSWFESNIEPYIKEKKPLLEERTVHPGDRLLQHADLGIRPWVCVETNRLGKGCFWHSVHYQCLPFGFLGIILFWQTFWGCLKNREHSNSTLSLRELISPKYADRHPITIWIEVLISASIYLQWRWSGVLEDIKDVSQLAQKNKSLPDDFGRGLVNIRQKPENTI